MKIHIENPVHFDSLAEVKRFFIFGQSEFADQIHLLLASRFPGRFYGFLCDSPNSERHHNSAFSFRFWKENIHLLGEGDYIFLAWRNKHIEKAFARTGARLGLPFNIRTIYATYETPTFLKFCQKYSKDMDIALDVGGNTGLTSAMLANYCNHVHVFEPNPDLKAVIEQTTSGLSNISIHMKAVSNVQATVQIFPVGPNNTSMVAKDKSNPFKVQSITLDNFCEQEKLQPSVIKVDVEGVDGEVILGARQVIKKNLPLLFFEHPLANANIYNTQLDIAKEALDFLNTHYTLLSYPTMDQLYEQVVDELPLDVFFARYGHYPVNVAGIPKAKRAPTS